MEKMVAEESARFLSSGEQKLQVVALQELENQSEMFLILMQIIAFWLNYFNKVDYHFYNY